MSMIYLPEYNSGNCAYIYNSDIIRVYESTPRQNTIINYKDYYIKSSYIYNEGQTTFGQYSSLPTCINSNRITTDYVFRNDFASILIIALSFIFVTYFLVSKCVRTLFIDWRYS